MNRHFYGDISDMGHAIIAYCHDPINKFQESYSVMGEPATALRDPVFYRWHSNVNEIFQHHKSHLPSYTKEEVIYFYLIHRTNQQYNKFQF